MNLAMSLINAHPQPTKILVYDVESNGLHGPSFAIAAVVFDVSDLDNPACVDTFLARAPLPRDVDPFVTANVLPAMEHIPVTHTWTYLHEDFWAWFQTHRESAAVFADCAWPVDSKVFSTAIGFDPARNLMGPYPLHDIATYLLALGIDPMTPRLELAEYPKPVANREHDPMFDAMVSAHALINVMRAQREVMDAVDVVRSLEAAHGNAPKRYDRWVITHDVLGVLLDTDIGVGVWSKDDPRGLDRAIVFASEKEIDEFCQTFGDMIYGDRVVGPRVHALSVETRNDDWATVEEIVAAGHDGWTPREPSDAPR